MQDDDRDSLAAEYVLGTLTADERDQAEALLAIDPGFAEVVRLWERRLGELNVMVEAVEPPPDLWDKIQNEMAHTERHVAPQAEEPVDADAVAFETAPDSAPEIPGEPEIEPVMDLQPEATETEAPAETREIDDSAVVAALASSLLGPEPRSEVPPPPPGPSLPPPTPRVERVERTVDVIYLARRVRRWRAFAMTVTAIAALLALFIAATLYAPGQIPLPKQLQTVLASLRQQPPQPQQPTQVPGARLVAVLQQDPTAPAFLLTVDPQSRTLTVRRVSATPDATRSYELWLIAGKSQPPHSLGVVGASEFTTRAIPADFDANALRAASYAVSLEPAGGSPSGVPTGPILFTGKMVESLPGSPS